MGYELVQSVKGWTREFGAFTLGMILGTCYGAVIATLVTYSILIYGGGAA